MEKVKMKKLNPAEAWHHLDVYKKNHDDKPEDCFALTITIDPETGYVIIEKNKWYGGMWITDESFKAGVVTGKESNIEWVEE